MTTMSVEKAVSIQAHCFNPSFNFAFVGQGVFPGGESEGTSAFIQFNIKTKSTGATVIYVDMHNGGICDFTVPAGLRVKRGSSFIDITNCYTRHEDYNNPTHYPPTEIINHVRIDHQISGNSIRFAVAALPSNLQGTISARFTVVYEAAQDFDSELL